METNVDPPGGGGEVIIVDGQLPQAQELKSALKWLLDAGAFSVFDSPAFDKMPSTPLDTCEAVELVVAVLLFVVWCMHWCPIFVLAVQLSACSTAGNRQCSLELGSQYLWGNRTLLPEHCFASVGLSSTQSGVSLILTARGPSPPTGPPGTLIFLL